MRKSFAAALIAAAVAVGAAAAGAATVTLFTDIGGHEHEQAIRAANAKGLFAGYEDGTFRPDRKLTNRQSEVVLRRLLDRYQDDDGDSTLTRGQAAALLAYGACGLDGDCGTAAAPRTTTTTTPVAPADTGYWTRSAFPDGPTEYLLVSDDKWNGRNWDRAFLGFACRANGLPGMHIYVPSLVTTGSISADYWPGDGGPTTTAWAILPWRGAKHDLLVQPSSTSQAVFARNIITNPGQFVFTYTDAGATITHRWPNTDGLAAVASYLYKVCGM